MENDKIVMSSDQLDTAIIELYNQIDTITASLNRIKDKFYDISEYFTGSVADEFQAKYAAYASKMTLIKDNLNVYIKDLMIVRNVFTQIDKKNAAEVERIAEETRIKAQQMIDNSQVGDLTIKQ